MWVRNQVGLAESEENKSHSLCESSALVHQNMSLDKGHWIQGSRKMMVSSEKVFKDRHRRIKQKQAY
jgi:hypothetical protein